MKSCFVRGRHVYLEDVNYDAEHEVGQHCQNQSLLKG